MSAAPFQALVVDDEMVARRMVMWALSNEDFRCTPAVDGTDALEKIKYTNFDLIITDLRMPNMDGHAMVVELMANSTGHVPMIVAHSSLEDPVLTKDLMMRGVDDVIYKPTNYAAFAAKMKGSLMRRKLNGENFVTNLCNIASETTVKKVNQDFEKVSPIPISIEDFDARLKDVVHIFPVSNTATEVLECIRDNDSDSFALAKLIGSDAILIMELLRLANTGPHGVAGRKILDLNDAIARLGTKRVCEVSLVVSELAGMTKLVLPWIDTELIRLRSMAGSKVAQRILQLDLSANAFDNGVVFSALMYPYCRVVVGSAYNSIYEKLLLECSRDAIPLRDFELEVFPRTPAASTVQVLNRWGLPAEVGRILSYADNSFESLGELPEKLRTSVKLLKLAIILAEHAVGRWMPWESASPIPADSFVRALNIGDTAKIIKEVRLEL